MPSDSEILDPEVIEGLRTVEEIEPGFIQDLVAAFKQQLAAGLPELKRALAENSEAGSHRADNLEQAARLAHGLKGSCANLGAARLAARFADYETIAGNGERTAGINWPAFETLLQKTLNALQALERSA